MTLSRLRAVFSRFLSSFRSRNPTLAEFDEEWRAHVESLAEQYQHQGMSPEEAQREARLRVGTATALRERQYEQAGFPFLDGLKQDLRYAARLMRKDWTFTLAVVLTLGVGIGVNTSVFTLVDALLLRGLPYRNPGQLISLHRLPGMEFSQSKAKFNEWKRASTLLDNAALLAESQVNIAGGLEPAHVHLAQVSANFPALFGAMPLLGRSFSPEEDSPGASTVALISSRLWQRQFNSDLKVLERPLLINGAKWTVVGVMPPAFDFPSGVDIWTPTIHSEAQLSQWGAVMSFMLARMKPGVTPAQVSAQQKSLFGKVYPELRQDSAI